MTTLKTVVVTTAVTLTTVAMLGAGVAFAQGGTPWGHMSGYGCKTARRRRVADLA